MRESGVFIYDVTELGRTVPEIVTARFSPDLVCICNGSNASTNLFEKKHLVQLRKTNNCNYIYAVQFSPVKPKTVGLLHFLVIGKTTLFYSVYASNHLICISEFSY